VVAEIEKARGRSVCSSKCLTIVVLPLPEGAEKTISLSVLKDI
jgi:hypothetical protein